MRREVREKGILFLALLLVMSFSLQAAEEKKLIKETFTFTEAQVQELNQLIQTCGSGVSVFYKDLRSGYTYTYNHEEKYFIASVIKAPYCLYILDLASQGKCDLEKKYTYQVRHQSGGTGKIQDMSIGTSFTLEELLRYAIVYSDNVAMAILKENFPVAGYTAYAKALGLKYPADIKNATNGMLSATDAGIYAEAIYQFIQNNPYGEKFRTWMLSTTNPMIVSSYPVVRKYGWATASFHDMAIVEAPAPYILSILTNHDGDFATFKKISQAIEKISQQGRIPEVVIESIEVDTLIEERKVKLAGYRINGENYYKLRDIAKVLDGTSKQFDISYDAGKAATVLLLNHSYSEEVKNTYLDHSTSYFIEEKQLSIHVNEASYRLPAYLIDHNNYMKIKDIAKMVQFQMSWSNIEKQMTLIV